MLHEIPQHSQSVPLTAYLPSLLDLWGTYKFHPGTLTILAEVPSGTVESMICGQPVHLDEAERVLVQLSKLLYKDFTLSTVYVPVIEGAV